MKLSPSRNDPVGLCHLKWGDDDVTLSNAHVGQIPLEDFAFLDAEHVGVVGDVSLGFSFERNTGFFSESESGGPVDEVWSPDF